MLFALLGVPTASSAAPSPISASGPTSGTRDVGCFHFTLPRTDPRGTAGPQGGTAPSLLLSVLDSKMPKSVQPVSHTQNQQSLTSYPDLTLDNEAGRGAEGPRTPCFLSPPSSFPGSTPPYATSLRLSFPTYKIGIIETAPHSLLSLGNAYPWPRANLETNSHLLPLLHRSWVSRWLPIQVGDTRSQGRPCWVRPYPGTSTYQLTSQ